MRRRTVLIKVVAGERAPWARYPCLEIVGSTRAGWYFQVTQANGCQCGWRGPYTTRTAAAGAASIRAERREEAEILAHQQAWARLECQGAFKARP